jgi:RHS repeat-associated protein
MTGAVEKTSGGTVLAQVSYTYDALGNRIGMDENGAQTWTLYDGHASIMDFNGSGSLEMRYLNGPTRDLVDSVIARESAGGTVAWYLPDRLGTVRDLINNSGAIIDHIDFSAFGTVLDQSDPSEGDRMMGFAGMELDSVTGMNLAVYRVQDPATGRWASRDPLGFAAGDLDLYRFVANDPSTLGDPSGLKFGRPGGLIGDPAEEELLAELAKRLGVPLKSLKGIQNSKAWQCVKNAKTIVHVRFLDTGINYGGTHLPNEDGTITISVNPARYISVTANHRRTPSILLDALIHEILHAALQVKCGDLGGGINDRPHDPNYPNGYSNGSDLNDAGQKYIDTLLGPVDLPPELPDVPDRYDPDEPKLGKLP